MFEKLKETGNGVQVQTPSKSENTEKSTNNVQWGSFTKGKLVVRSNEMDPKAVSRMNKMGKEVWETKYSNFTGYIYSLYLNKSQYGEQWVLGLLHKDGVLNITISLKSPYYNSLVRSIGQIDVNKRVLLKGYSFQNEKGKMVDGFTIYQSSNEDSTFDLKIAKEMPTDCPELKFELIDGKYFVDNITKAKQDAFIKAYVNDLVVQHGLQPSKTWFSEEQLDNVLSPLVDNREMPMMGTKEESNDTKEDSKVSSDDEQDFDDLFDQM